MTTLTGTKRFQLGQLLLNNGVITQEQLDKALTAQRESNGKLLLGEVLLKQGLCEDWQIMEALATGYDVPFTRITSHVADPKMLELIPREFIEKHCILPLYKIRNTLTIAVSEPANVFMIEEVERLTGFKTQVVCATEKDILQAFENYLPSANVFVIDGMFDDEETADLALVEDRVDDISDLEVLAEGSPVIKLVNYLIFHAVREGASDIHVEPDENQLRIRYRVDGALYEKLRPPHKMLPAISSRIKIMAGLDISERRLPQDGGIHVLMDGRPIDLRVSTMPGQFGEKIVIRVIDNRNILVNLEKLGFSYEMLKEWRKVLAVPTGIVLVTGPTGSGKSTTLYSSLKEVNREDINICTVEDPVEFNLGGVNQFQVNDKVGFTFASSLRSLLRQDPDVIMVGEIRDNETARIAVQAALTGHQVLSTLHTNDAPGAITRLLNIGIEPYLISASISGILAQRLVRKICTHCKEAYDPAKNIRSAVEKITGPVETFYKGAGCTKCRNTGFIGRIGIYEMLAPNDALRDQISDSLSIDELRKAAKESGMTTLREDGMAKVKAGITTVEEVFKATAA